MKILPESGIDITIGSSGYIPEKVDEEKNLNDQQLTRLKKGFTGHGL